MWKSRGMGSVLLAVMAACLAVGDERAGHGDSMPRAVELLTQPDARSRALGARTLGDLGREAAGAGEALASALADRDPEVAVQAATALGRIGASAVSAFPALIAALDSKDEHVRYAAAWAVSEIVNDLDAGEMTLSSESFEDCLARLVAAERALRVAGSPKPAELVRRAAIDFQDFRPSLPPKPAPVSEDRVLESKPPLAASDGRSETVQTLLHQVAGEDLFRRIQAAHRLSRLGDDGVPAMLDALRIAEQRTRGGADFEDLLSLGPLLREALEQAGPAAAPALAEALADPAVNSVAADVLKQLGPSAYQVAPRLIAMLTDAAMEPDAQTRAAEILGTMGRRAERAVEPLTAIVRDEGQPDDLRCAAATSLGQIGPPARSAATALIQVMENQWDSDSVRAAAAEALAGVGTPAAEIVPPLVARLDDDDELDFVQAAACRCLAAFGDEGQAAAASLVRLLDQDDLWLGTIAAQTLSEFTSPPANATQPLLRLLEHEEADLETQRAVAAALGKIGSDAIGALVERLAAADEPTRARIAAAIARIGPRAAEAVNPLAEILRDEGSPLVRRFAVIALGALGPASQPAVDDLLAVLTSVEEDSRLRVTAATALGELKSTAAESAAALAELVEDADAPGEVRAACVLALSQVAPEATADLLRAIRSDEPLVRIAAARALYQVDLARNHALPALLSALEQGRVGHVAAEVLRDIGSEGVRHLCDTVRDQDLEMDIRRTAVRMLGEHFMLGELREEAARVLIECLYDEALRDEAEAALLGVGPAAIPLLLAERDKQQQRDARDKALDERLRALVLQLCIPTGEGGDEGWFEEPTGFDQYDRLGVYQLPRTRARIFELAPGIEKPAWPDEAPVPEAAAEPETQGEPAFLKDSPAASTPGFKTVKVFYGTNRQAEKARGTAAAPLQDYALPAAIAGLVTLLFAMFSFAVSRARWRAAIIACGLAITLGLAYNATGIARRVDYGDVPAELRYGSQHSEAVQLGTCEVSIPATHQVGQLEGPSVLRLEWQEDPLQHIVLQRVERYEPERFFDELRSDLARSDDSILVFVHGYNVTFEDAARRTAQMAYDLEFQGAPMFYSWPSQGNWYRYREDEEYVELAVAPIKKFLLEVATRSQARSIHLIAHSMGNRALTGALREIQLETRQQQVLFNQVVLAAPDINADVFKQTIAPAIARSAERVTLYASSNDLALVASRAFNAGGPRAGDAGAGPVVVAGIETIDVSGADTDLLGHSYYGSSASVLDDLRLLLLRAAPADLRPGLNAVAGHGGKYWVYRHSETAHRRTSVPDVTY